MNREELTYYSRCLDREMHIMIYGQGGIPFLSFPTQDSMCHNYEEFGMIHHLADLIEEGRIQLFVVDTVDRESWSPKEGDKEYRAARQEQYFHYITDEVIPLIRSRNPRTPAVTGFSMGADHAVITFLRRPDLFRGVIALSGVYDADYFFDGWMNPTLYDNSPERFLPNMPADHPYMEMYRNSDIIICVGQGAWEEQLLAGTRKLDAIVKAKGISAWIDYWGHDVYHDWPWWKIQIRYFLEKMGI